MKINDLFLMNEHQKKNGSYKKRQIFSPKITRRFIISLVRLQNISYQKKKKINNPITDTETLFKKKTADYSRNVERALDCVRRKNIKINPRKNS